MAVITNHDLSTRTVIGKEEEFMIEDQFFSMLLQYPDQFGEVKDYQDLVHTAHEKEIKVAVAADLLSLTLLCPPGEWGADVVVGTTQRF